MSEIPETQRHARLLAMENVDCRVAIKKATYLLESGSESGLLSPDTDNVEAVSVSDDENGGRDDPGDVRFEESDAYTGCFDYDDKEDFSEAVDDCGDVVFDASDAYTGCFDSDSEVDVAVTRSRAGSDLIDSTPPSASASASTLALDDSPRADVPHAVGSSNVTYCTYVADMHKVNSGSAGAQISNEEMIADSVVTSVVATEPIVVTSDVDTVPDLVSGVARAHEPATPLCEEDCEVSCRICKMTVDDAPDMKLYSPCLCKGSQAYVHVECLNLWRKTSAEAYSCCSVCKHKYIIERSVLADLVSSPMVLKIVTALLFSAILMLVGLAVMKMSEFFEFNLMRRCVHWLDMYDVRLRECRHARRVTNRHLTEFKGFFDRFHTDSLNNFVYDACAAGSREIEGIHSALGECAAPLGQFTPAAVARDPSKFISFVIRAGQHRPSQLLNAAWEFVIHCLVHCGLSVFTFLDECLVAVVCGPPAALLFFDSLLMGFLCLGVGAVLTNLCLSVYARILNQQWDQGLAQEIASIFMPMIGLIYASNFRGMHGSDGFSYRGIYFTSQIIGGVYKVYCWISSTVQRSSKEFQLASGETIQPIPIS